MAVAFKLANRTNGTIITAGEKRAYLLYVPESYDPSTPTALVITIHGFAQWPAHQMQITHWNDLADKYGFIVVYPAGTRFPLRWRTHGEPGSDLDPMRDVTFISELIDKLEADFNIDPARIYANGLSNGGGMSFLLSCRLSDRIAAIGTVAGAFLIPWEECQPSRPVPTMVFHGTADPIVPYQGGSYRDEAAFPAIPDWVDMLAQRNGCNSAPLEIPANGEASGIQFTDCTADVVFYTITGGGHSWPGGGLIPEWIVGHTTQDIDATKTMWEFFQLHPLGAQGVLCGGIAPPVPFGHCDPNGVPEPVPTAPVPKAKVDPAGGSEKLTMSELNPEKLHVTYHKGTFARELSLPRQYTLTHSDTTGDLFLSVGADYDQEQISGFYTRLMRDEVLAEFKDEDGAVSLHVYCHVSGGLVFGTAGWRNDILHHHMRMVIEALRYGDRELVSAHPELDQAEVRVHFASNHARYNQMEDWGHLKEYEVE